MEVGCSLNVLLQMTMIGGARLQMVVMARLMLQMMMNSVEG